MSTYSSGETLQSINLIPKGRIGRFIVEREIGQGSVGTVYLFRDPLIGRKVAIKVLNPKLPFDQRKAFEKHFIQEARAAGRLNHPNIVTVYDADKSDDLLYIAMEHLDGRELRDILSSGHQFTFKQIADMVARIAKALDYAHQNGVIHRDIKPANIFIVGKYTPKVLDFGIASATRQVTDPDVSQGITVSADRRLLGTPSYMSPEQTRAEIVDGRSDIFSLGVVLYQLLCGQLPFKGDTIQQLLENIEYESPVPPHDINKAVPSRLAYIAGKALAKKPADRYATAGEMANDLNRFIAKERTNQIIATLREPLDEKEDMAASGNLSQASAARQGLIRNRLPALLGLGALVAIVGVMFVAWTSHRAAPHKGVPPPLQAESRAVSAVGSVRPVVLAAASQPTTASGGPSTAPALIEAEPNAVAPKDTRAAASRAESTAARSAARSISKARSKSRAEKIVAMPIALGKVLIAVSPWGEVFVDGKSRGVAPPLSQLSLPIGAHSIEIRNGEEKYVVKVQVTSEKDTKVGHRF